MVSSPFNLLNFVVLPAGNTNNQPERLVALVLLWYAAGMMLSPFVATGIFVLACLAGYKYRRVWKSEGPRWQLWVFGGVAAACLLTLGFVPLAVPG